MILHLRNWVADKPLLVSVFSSFLSFTHQDILFGPPRFLIPMDQQSQKYGIFYGHLSPKLEIFLTSSGSKILAL